MAAADTKIHNTQHTTVLHTYALCSPEPWQSRNRNIHGVSACCAAAALGAKCRAPGKELTAPVFGAVHSLCKALALHPHSKSEPALVVKFALVHFRTLLHGLEGITGSGLLPPITIPFYTITYCESCCGAATSLLR